MKHSGALCSYLANQMHEKYGIQKGSAQNMVRKWLESIEKVRTLPRSAVEKETLSRREPPLRKTV